MSTAQEPQEVAEEKVDDGDVDVPAFLHNALRDIGFLPQPEPHASAWQVEPVTITKQDGSTMDAFFAVETRIRGNKIEVYWYNLEDLNDHVRNAALTLQKLTMLLQAHNPLVVANKQQMQAVVEQAKQSGIIIPGR